MVNKLKPTDIATRFEALGLDTIEISNARNPIAQRKIDTLIRELKKDFKLIIKVGSKIKHSLHEQDWTDEFKQAVDVDPYKLVLEGGGAGDKFIFDEQQDVRILLLTRLLALAEEQAVQEKIMIEAPRAEQMAVVMHIFGWNTHISNIPANTMIQANELRLKTITQHKNGPKRAKKIADVLSAVKKHCAQCNECTLEQQLSVGIPARALVSDQSLDQLEDFYTQHRWRRQAPIRIMSFGDMFE